MITFLSSNAYSAAWLQKSGDWQVISNFNYYSTSSYFNSDGDSLPQKKFIKGEVNPYIEYGLTDKLTVGISPSFQYLLQNDSADKSQNNYGLADSEVFLRKKIWNDYSSVLSLQGLVKIPGPYSTGQIPTLGLKQYDVEARILYGKNLLINYYKPYINLEVAYRKRMEEPSDEFRFDTSVGLNLTDNYMILGQVFNVYSLGDIGNQKFITVNSFDYSLSKVQLSAVKKLSERLSLQLGVYKNIWGRNTGKGGGILVSLWKKF